MPLSTFTRLTACAAFATSLVLFAGCGGGQTVDRKDERAVVDLSGNWNATDSTLVADALIADCLSHKWLENFNKTNNRVPVVKIGRITVRSNGDVISTQIFANDLVRALINSGKAEAVASNAENDQAREERKQQDVNASEATRKESFQETGTDFLIIGEINVQDDQAGGVKQKFFSTDLKMTDVKTQRQVWIGNKKHSKIITRK